MTQTPNLKAGMTLVVASHNPGKVYEIKQMLAPYGLSVVSAGDLDLPEPEETEPTFAGNARLKALAAARASGHPALADDSGLEVDALGGAPGIFSARWAGPDKDFSAAMEKVAVEVKGRHGWSAPGPRASFICVLCLAWPGGECEVFEGKVFGHLVWPVRGGNGFGYDPMFQPDGESETFGEMEPERKHAMSHRARAFAAFQSEKLAGLPQVAANADPDAVAEEGLAAAAANLSNRAELVSFVANLIADFEARPKAWRARTLKGFLAGLEVTLRTDGEGTGSRLEEAPKWRAMALALLAARNDSSQ